LIRQALAIAAALAVFAAGAPFCAGDARPTSIPTNLEMLEDLVRTVVEENAGKIPLEPGETVVIRHAGGHEVGWIVENYLAGRLASLGASVYLEPEMVMPAAEEAQAAEPEQERETKGPGPRRQGAAEGAGGQGVPDSTDAARDSDDDDSWPPKSFYEAVGDSLEEESAEDRISLAEALKKTPQETEKSRPSAAAQGVLMRAPFSYGDAPEPDRVLEFRVGELDVDYTRRWRKSLFGSSMVERSARAAIFFKLLDGADGKLLWTGSGRSQRRDVVPQKMLAELEDTPGRAGAERPRSGGIGRMIEPIVVSGIVVGLVVLFYSSRT
jgi:hypothetical protein